MLLTAKITHWKLVRLQARASWLFRQQSPSFCRNTGINRMLAHLATSPSSHNAFFNVDIALPVSPSEKFGYLLSLRSLFLSLPFLIL